MQRTRILLSPSPTQFRGESGHILWVVIPSAPVNLLVEQVTDQLTDLFGHAAGLHPPDPYCFVQFVDGTPVRVVEEVCRILRQHYRTTFTRAGMRADWTVCASRDPAYPIGRSVPAAEAPSTERPDL